MKLKPLDKNGKKLAIGEQALLVDISAQLLYGLPNDDQQAINNQIGKTITLHDFDERGFAEVEFEYVNDLNENIIHTIWVPPNSLEKINNT